MPSKELVTNRNSPFYKLLPQMTVAMTMRLVSNRNSPFYELLPQMTVAMTMRLVSNRNSPFYDLLECHFLIYESQPSPLASIVAANGRSDDNAFGIGP